MYQIKIWLLSAMILVTTLGPSQAAYCERIVNRTTTAQDPQTLSLCKTIIELEKSNYPTEDVNALKRVVTAQISILERVKNLENFYGKLKSVVDWLTKIVETIGKFLGISTKPDTGSSTNVDPAIADYHHISGAVMSTGAVSFTARTGDAMSFDAHDIDELEMDVYYNKNLFTIDRIVGDGVQGRDFTKLTLPLETRSSRDRIQVPLSDVLASKTTFYIYLAPLNGDLAQVGDQTKVNIRYYKRVDPGELAPIIYELKPGSTDTIKIIAKSPV